MSKTYSCDPNSKVLWSWDGEFHYEGITRVPPKGTLDFFGENREYYEACGALFLSGYRHDCAVIWCENEAIDLTVWFGRLENGKIVEAKGHSIETATDPWDKILHLVAGIKGKIPIVFCGEAVRNPETVAKLCKAFPSESIYVCPMVDELAAFGNLAIHVNDKPRKVPLWIPNTSPLGFPSIEFDPNLNGDGYGRMAQCVLRGEAVFNDMKQGVGLNTFYGAVIHDGTCGDTRFIVRLDEVVSLFPFAPISAKYFAASTVFVSMEPSDKFRKLTGVTAKMVDVVVSTENIPDLPTFMHFYWVMSKKDFVGVSRKEHISFRRNVPVFRYNRAYRLTKEEFDGNSAPEVV